VHVVAAAGHVDLRVLTDTAPLRSAAELNPYRLMAEITAQFLRTGQDTDSAGVMSRVSRR
jgi:hypothetical protein